MANERNTGRTGAGARSPKNAPANNVDETEELTILGSVRDFMIKQNLSIQRAVAKSKESGNPSIRFQDKTGKGNKDLDLEGNGVTGIVLSRNASDIYDFGDKIDIDSLSVGFGKGEQGQDRYVICTGGVFEDESDI